MKTLFKEDTVQNNQTPGQTAMKGLFAEESKAGAQTPNQVSRDQFEFMRMLLGCNENAVQRRQLECEQDPKSCGDENTFCRAEK